jgi:3-hydroxyisobutyrate dehydrogenase-like beta-hydroxyacid dehydrogenase
MSTVSPTTYLQPTVVEEVTFMCSVSGSVKPAQDGTLVILVGSTVKVMKSQTYFLTY